MESSLFWNIPRLLSTTSTQSTEIQNEAIQLSHNLPVLVAPPGPPLGFLGDCSDEQIGVQSGDFQEFFPARLVVSGSLDACLHLPPISFVSQSGWFTQFICGPVSPNSCVAQSGWWCPALWMWGIIQALILRASMIKTSPWFWGFLGPCWAYVEPMLGQERRVLFEPGIKAQRNTPFWVMSVPCWAYVGFMLVRTCGLFEPSFSLYFCFRKQASWGTHNPTLRA